MNDLLYLIAASGGCWTAACVLTKRAKPVAVVLALAGSFSALFAVLYAATELPQPQGVLVAAGLWGLTGLAYKRTEQQVDKL